MLFYVFKIHECQEYDLARNVKKGSWIGGVLSEEESTDLKPREQDRD